MSETHKLVVYKSCMIHVNEGRNLDWKRLRAVEMGRKYIQSSSDD